jgi:hypothetical protein
LKSSILLEPIASKNYLKLHQELKHKNKIKIATRGLTRRKKFLNKKSAKESFIRTPKDFTYLNQTLENFLKIQIL